MIISEGINVIRVGLQPTEEINAGKDVVAGPFHPAFRELMEGSLLCDAIRDAMEGIRAEELAISINSKDISKLYANRKEYFNELKMQLKIKNIRVTTTDILNRGEMILETGKSSKKILMPAYLRNKYKATIPLVNITC
jgi:hypothetical protein